MTMTAPLDPSEHEHPRHWYLLQSKPRQIERALEHLQRQGYRCFLPTRRIERISKGRRQEVEEVLFPNYLFIHLSPEQDNWMPIRSTRGVSRLVSFGGPPVTVPNELIEKIRHHAVPAIATPLQHGDKVRIHEGSFAEIEAIVLSQDGEDRVMLLIALLHRENTIQVPLKSISKIS